MPEETITRDLVILNKLGLHARPAAMFVQLSSKFSSELIVEKDSEKVNGKSIMGIMMLAAGQGSTLTVTAIGEDAVEAVDSIEKLIRDKFGEE